MKGTHIFMPATPSLDRFVHRTQNQSGMCSFASSSTLRVGGGYIHTEFSLVRSRSPNLSLVRPPSPIGRIRTRYRWHLSQACEVQPPKRTHNCRRDFFFFHILCDLGKPRSMEFLVHNPRATAGISRKIEIGPDPKVLGSNSLLTS